MSVYTIQLRNYVEDGGLVFDFDYPIFDETYRGVLETKIINHYYFREIGLETMAQFKHFLKSRLNIVMPYYNQLYETLNLVTKDNYNINLDNTITKTNNVDTSTNNTTTGTTNVTGSANTTDDNTTTTGATSREIFSDTPQGTLNNLDYATTLSDGTTDGTSTASGTSTVANSQDSTDQATTQGTLTTIEQYTEHLLGNGSMRYNADILVEWRESFLNIDLQIIDELQDLFMNIY